ncbi:MAG: alpha/beta hydrolase [Reyranellaceae bacterium]
MMDWGKMSRAERDAAYNNSMAVKNSAELNAEREAQSAAFRRAHPGHLDLRYGPRERNTWDLFPAASPNAPCFVFIHGGYWQRNSKDQFANLIAGIHARGWSAALPGYTLAPDASLTEIVAEIDTALDWLGDNGAAHGIAGKAILSGWSAGGHLTAACLGHRRIDAGLAVSGVFELGPIRDTYLNEKLKLTDDEIAALSPLRQPMIRKPLAITYGTNELPPLVGDSRALHAKRAAEHLPGALIPIAGADHFTIVTQLPKPDSDLVHQILLLA